MYKLRELIQNFSIQSVQSLFRRNLNKFRADEINYDFLFEDKEIIVSRFCNIQKIAEAELDNSGDMAILTAQSIKELTSKSGKKIQYEIAKHILIEERKDAAIFIFYDEDGNFRFSFIRANYWGSRKDYTSFKRYTYYVNNNQTNKTFISQMKKTDFNNLDSIQEAFSVEPLTKEFYEKLQHWYFWAIHIVRFPSEPNAASLFSKTGRASSEDEVKELINEQRAQNVIRLLTRILFVWFIKQKKLIPDELFDLDLLRKNILNDIEPVNHKDGLFAHRNDESIYYKAILQNLFFATLNCPAESSTSDKRSRGFAKSSNFGTTYLMRYEKYFRKPESFIELVNSVVPFLNGGLFECLDVRGEKEKREDRRYIDGFSDNLPKEHRLIVPDYLFFGVDDKTDLSMDLGNKSKKAKEASVKGLINIFREYNFTIDENEPDDIEVALDPELLGKVFENLLASYNPETKTTARKQTGSFYTPRAIVNYMVDESLIAYLKNNVDFDCDEKKQDEKLHTLFSYTTENPFENDAELTNKLLIAIDKCKILDPACGSGAFPMGILQKIVHILRKLDPGNEMWQKIQLEKAIKETSKAFKIMDKNERVQLLLDINEAFDETINSPDYSRKIFIIENCIYGVDIQPIAAQISKLRFFISLVVEQNVNDKKENNFGIRPLPNLETKFVTANTLIGIERPGDLFSIYESKEVKDIQRELKAVRHKYFSARTKETKSKYREKDKELRELIAEELKSNGWGNDAANKLAKWDPYNQNISTSFFDPEWMFDISDGFDIVIGNPPYGVKLRKDILNACKKKYYLKSSETSILFIEKGNNLLNDRGSLSYILPKALAFSSKYRCARNYVKRGLQNVVDCGMVFDKVKLEAIVISFCKKNVFEWYYSYQYISKKFFRLSKINKSYIDKFDSFLNSVSEEELKIGEYLNKLDKLNQFIENRRGANIQNLMNIENNGIEVIGGKSISRFSVKRRLGFVNEEVFLRSENAKIRSNSVLCQNIVAHIQKPVDHIMIIANIPDREYAILDTLNQLEIRDNSITEYFLWCILNSYLINWYLYRFIFGKAIRTMHFDNPITDRIPVKLHQNLFLFRVLYEISINSIDIKNKLFLVDAIVFELYFEEHMKERNIDVMQFVEKDIEDVFKGREFEQLSETEKDDVVKELANRWSNPESEIVKRINSFKEKSPDILKVILEN